MNTTTAKQVLTSYAVLVAAGELARTVLGSYDELANAEHHRMEWLDDGARRPGHPVASTYLRIDHEETDILSAIGQLAAMLADRKAGAHIRMAVQTVQDWRNGRDL